MKKLLLFVFLTIVTLVEVNAQRYVTAQFTGVTRSTAIYGSNFTVLTIPVTGRTARQPLVTDIYQPTGDTVSRRPLMIFVPTGNFLPKDVRQSPTGDRTDSVAVEMCNRFARMGYVSAAIDYRLGWNPIASQQTERVFTLINAAYRGVQDLRTAIRYFKANAATLRIDTTRIMAIGDGTGGYITLAGATLDAYLKTVTTIRPQGKFTTVVNNQVVPMVIEALNGTIEGKNLTIAPAGTPYPAGDTLNAPSWSANTSTYHFSVNLGGAVGDISWLDANSHPIASIACPYDQNAPYRDSVLLVPIGNGQALPVVQVQGSHWVALKSDSIGTTSGFRRLTAQYDPYRNLVAARNLATGYGNTYASGLLPLLGRSNADSSPWQWWNQDSLTARYGATAAGLALAGNPGMSKAKATAYIDTIMTFVAPRACVALRLPCAGVVTSTEELLNSETVKLTVAPNPAQSAMAFESEVYNPIKAIELYDMSGRLVRNIPNVNNHFFQMQRNGLPDGMYIAKVKFEGGILSKKVVFNQ